MALHILLAIVIGTILASLADWLFGGVLVHRYYGAHPEVWRTDNERGRIPISQALVLLSAIGFVALAVKLGQTDLRGALKLAGMIWIVAPLPIQLTNHLFFKLHPIVTAGLAAGWLVRLLLIAATTAALL